tara:strand:+ start:136 stop:471 length:336 start_codon:yes stop_codon:yes gene_type:complete
MSILLVISYVSLWLEISASKKLLKYRPILNTIFRLGIGILLISAQVPSVYYLITETKSLDSKISPIMVSAGIIIILTFTKEDVENVIEVLYTDFIKPKNNRFNRFLHKYFI